MLDIRSLTNLLTRLHSSFDVAIMNGDSFEKVKKIYIQIKDLEKQIAERNPDLPGSGITDD